eukprot:TRINITY_DN6533_c0_g1_i2.p1 TRINITY_DN6533_c0_g1~~TRINITY_DN6533_c0_g1_i2.p1  ORF type:complete len:140 (-),score=27.60 TRINITY_DN6533_c0_g1_i2:289-657(-)
MQHAGDRVDSAGAAAAAPWMESFERSPPGDSPNPFAMPVLRSEDEQARARRQQELAGDEELAAMLAAQLRLTSPVEYHEPTEGDLRRTFGGLTVERLPRVGDSTNGTQDGPRQADGARQEAF